MGFATLAETPRSFGARSPHSIVSITKSTESNEARFERDVHDGLGRVRKSLPSMYFYDEYGSALFAKIMTLQEYYPTRTEREILRRHAAAMVAPFTRGSCDVVDLGAGNGEKTRLVLEQLQRASCDVRYVPLDISEDALLAALDACTGHLPDLSAEGVVAEYTDGVRWLAERDTERHRLVLFLGSNIGNLDAAASREFLRGLRAGLRPGDHVLMGFDLLKDIELLNAAYADGSGVTAAFNLNLLRRINRELDGSFELAGFRHYATFSPDRRRMESFLVSLRRQSVRVGRRRYDFEAWEPIHTEISCKYDEAEVSRLARDAGFTEVAHFTDEKKWFLDALWRVDEGNCT